MSRILIFPVDPVGRHLKSLMFHHHSHGSVLDPGVNGMNVLFGKYFFDLLRFCLRRDVPVARCAV